MPAGLAWRVCLALAVALAADGVAESRDTFLGHARSDGGGLLVLGTQKGLLPQEMRVFLASLRAVGCRAEVVIFSADTGGRADLAEVADTFGARMIEYNFEDMSAKYGPMNLHRFRLFSDFLAAADTPYEQVLMCDIRDVFFQLDPFQELAVSEGLGVALEPEHLTIGACAIHARWLSDECLTYQQETVLDSIANKSRSCAGTTIGTHEAVAAYCEIMQQEARRTVHAVSAEQARAFAGRITTFDGQQWWGWCNDQAMHNALLWSGRLEERFPVTLYSAEKSPLATVGTMKTLRMNAEGELLAGCAVGNSNEEDEEGGHRDHQERGRDGLDTRDEDEEAECGGRVAALVHQYDRVEHLVRYAQALYGLEGEVFQTFQERWGGTSTS